jgi:hypothetical protein
MNRRIQFRLNNVTPTPATLRLEPAVDLRPSELDVNLGQLVSPILLRQLSCRSS